MASFFNHSCEPNLHQSFVGEESQIVFLKATRDIDAGQELTITYVDLLQGYSERQDNFKIKYGFNCCCQRCAYETLTPFSSYNVLVQLSDVENLVNQNELCLQAFHQNISNFFQSHAEITKNVLASGKLDMRNFI